MRNIKFRAWDSKQKLYVNVDTLSWTQGGFYFSDGCTTQGWLEANKDFGYLELLEIALEQWTGLYDKNGKEIYEGDIVKDIEDGKIWGIEFFKGEFVAVDVIEPHMGHILWSLAEHAEIIGNIHERGGIE